MFRYTTYYVIRQNIVSFQGVMMPLPRQGKHIVNEGTKNSNDSFTTEKFIFNIRHAHFLKIFPNFIAAVCDKVFTFFG